MIFDVLQSVGDHQRSCTEKTRLSSTIGYRWRRILETSIFNPLTAYDEIVNSINFSA